MKAPRLIQPLMKQPEYPEMLHELGYSMVRAYDCIYNLLYMPNDITPAERIKNAEINLSVLGDLVLKLAGEQVFSHDPRQLEFDLNQDEGPITQE